MFYDGIEDATCCPANLILILLIVVVAVLLILSLLS